MRLRETFTLYKRKVPSGKVVWYYQCYDGRRPMTRNYAEKGEYAVRVHMLDSSGGFHTSLRSVCLKECFTLHRCIATRRLGIPRPLGRNKGYEIPTATTYGTQQPRCLRRGC
jgi:hypothetical protein